MEATIFEPGLNSLNSVSDYVIIFEPGLNSLNSVSDYVII